MFGDPHARYVGKLQPTVEKINALEADFLKLSDEELRGKTVEFRGRLGLIDAPPLTPPRQGGETKKISSPFEGEVRRGQITLDELLP